MTDTEVLQRFRVQEIIDNAVKAIMNSSVPCPRSSKASAPAMTASTFRTSAPNSYTSAAIGISGVTLIATTGTSMANTHPEASA